MKLDLTEDKQFEMVNALVKTSTFSKSEIVKALRCLKSFDYLIVAIDHAEKALISLSKSVEALDISIRSKK